MEAATDEKPEDCWKVRMKGEGQRGGDWEKRKVNKKEAQR